MAWADAGLHGGVVAGAEHVRQRQQRRHERGVFGDGQLHQRPVGQGDAHGLALSSVHARVSPLAPVAAGDMEALGAEIAGVVRPYERCHHDIAALEAGHLRADLLDDADELVPHPFTVATPRHRLVWPQVAAANTRPGDAHDRVGRFAQGRVGDVLDPDVARGVHHCCSHGLQPFVSLSLVLTGNRRVVAAGQHSLETSEARIGTARQCLLIQVMTEPLSSTVRRLPWFFVDHRTDIRDFLKSRRARITPQEAGLPIYGGNRRVPGLRREEVALLAGVSVDYYTRLERGNLSGVSESVLDAVARALHLDEAERGHLFDLARTANAAPHTRRRASPAKVRPSIQRVLDAITGAPAWVHNDRLDFIAANRLGYALYSEMFTDVGPVINSARFVFLNARSHDFYPNWEHIADNSVAILRGAAGRNPYDEKLSNLIGELSTRSEDFRVRWAAHNVRLHRTGVKHLHHPAVGDLELTYEAMELPADPGLTMFVYTAEPASPSEDGLKLLASLAATHDRDGTDSSAGLEPRAPTSPDSH